MSTDASMSLHLIDGTGEVRLGVYDGLHGWPGMTARVIWCTAATKDSPLPAREMQPLCGQMAAPITSLEGSNELVIM